MKRRKPRHHDLFAWARWQKPPHAGVIGKNARKQEVVQRDAGEPQSYLAWFDEVPYLVTWTPGEDFGRLTVQVADQDFAPLAAAPWDATIRMDAARVGLEAIVNANIRMHHEADRAAARIDQTSNESTK